MEVRNYIPPPPVIPPNYGKGKVPLLPGEVFLKKLAFLYERKKPIPAKAGMGLFPNRSMKQSA